MMQMQPKKIIIAFVALIVLIVVIKACQRTKQIEVKQKVSDEKSALSVEIKKEKPEQPK
jgi:hypothetical protein